MQSWTPQLVKSLSSLYSNSMIGFLVSIPNLVGLASMIIVSRSSDHKLERRYHVAIPAIIAAGALVLLGATRSPFYSLTLLSFLAAGVYSCFGPFWALPSEFLTGFSAAAGIALINSVGNLGGFAGPYLIGTIATRTGSLYAGLSMAGVALFMSAMLVLILFVGPLQDALFGVVLVANTLIGIVQELRAKRTLDRLTVLTAPTATVVRDGEAARVAPSAIVRDDVVALAPGDQVVVDGEVLTSERLEIDESLLTGESEPVVKAPGDRALSGSFVAAGTGRIRVSELGAVSGALEMNAVDVVTANDVDDYARGVFLDGVFAGIEPFV